MQFEERMLKILKFLINAERNSIIHVSNFSANNQEDKMHIDTNSQCILNKKRALLIIYYSFNIKLSVFLHFCLNF